MKLVKNAGKIMRRSHSMRSFYLLAALIVWPDLIYRIAGLDFSPALYWSLFVLIVLYGISGRLMDQGIDDV